MYEIDDAQLQIKNVSIKYSSTVSHVEVATIQHRIQVKFQSIFK